MKKQFLLLAGTVLSSATMFAQVGQIANNGFNTWSQTTNPDNWTTSASGVGPALVGTQFASFSGMIVPMFAPTSTEETTTVAEGSSAVKLKTVATTAPVSSLIPTAPGVLGLGNFDIAAVQSGSDVMLTGAAFAYKPDTITFKYKYTPAGTDTATFIVKFDNNSTDVAGGQHSLEFTATDATYQTATLVLTSFWTGTPNNAILQFASGSVAGSELLVDGLHFGYVTAPTATPVVTISASEDSIAENGGVSVISLHLSEAATSDITIELDMAAIMTSTASPDMGSGGDFSISPFATSIVVPAGVTDTSVTITAIDDTEVEGTETINIALAAGTGYVLGTPSSLTVYILDDETTTGINNVVLNAIRVYPNPASTNVNVVIPSEVAAQNVAIVDLNGKVVATKNVAGASSINVSNLAAGNYVMTFTDATTKAFTGSKSLVIAK